jgi:hypothetical protein
VKKIKRSTINIFKLERFDLIKKMKTVHGRPNFNPNVAEEVAKSFKAAMKGIGCDEKRIIKEIINLSVRQIIHLILILILTLKLIFFI